MPLLVLGAEGRWTITGSLNLSGGIYHTATLLPNGKVLVAGGESGDGPIPTIATAELYDPASGTWAATGSMKADVPATQLPFFSTARSWWPEDILLT